MRKLTIGIVNWNTKDLLERCLNSVNQQKTDFTFTVVVVDNASSDGSTVIVKKPFFLIQNKDNIGMAAGLNQVIEKYPAEYYLFLHPDAILGKDTLQKMVIYLDEHPEVGIAGPHLVYPNGKNFASAHRFPTLNALFNESLPLSVQRKGLHGLYLRTMDYSKEQKVDIIASACCFVSKKLIDDLGLLDARFGNWMAEWDLAARSKQKNWKVMYIPITEVIHYEGHTTLTKAGLEYKKYSYVIADKMLNSLFLFYEKHYSRTDLFILKSCTLLGLIAKSLLYTPQLFYPRYSKDARTRILNYLKTSKKCVS